MATTAHQTSEEDEWVQQIVLRIMSLGAEKLSQIHLPPVIVDAKPPKRAKTMYKAVAIVDDVPLRRVT